MSSYMDLLVDQDTGDLDISSGDFAFTEDSGTSLRQRLEQRFLTWKGEWPYDETFGMPYKQSVLIAGATKAVADAAFIAQISLEDDVDSILNMTSTYDASTRGYVLSNVEVYVEDEVVNLSLVNPTADDYTYTYPTPSDTSSTDFNVCSRYAGVTSLSFSWGIVLSSNESNGAGYINIETEFIADGTVVTVDFNDVEYTAEIEDDAASVYIAKSVLSALDDNTEYSVYISFESDSTTYDATSTFVTYYDTLTYTLPFTIVDDTGIITDYEDTDVYARISLSSDDAVAYDYNETGYQTVAGNQVTYTVTLCDSQTGTGNEVTVPDDVEVVVALSWSGDSSETLPSSVTITDGSSVSFTIDTDSETDESLTTDITDATESSGYYSSAGVNLSYNYVYFDSTVA